MSKYLKIKISRITLQEILNKREKKCERCGRSDMLTLDHIVPINILRLLGQTVEE